MAIKVYACPDEVPVPDFDYMNYNSEVIEAQETEHKAALKKFYYDMGFTGKRTGLVYEEGVADGAALYMVFEAPRGSNFKEKFFLIHLPYCDGYQSRTVHHMTKTGLCKVLDAQQSFKAKFASLAKGA